MSTQESPSPTLSPSRSILHSTSNNAPNPVMMMQQQLRMLKVNDDAETRNKDRNDSKVNEEDDTSVVTDTAHGEGASSCAESEEPWTANTLNTTINSSTTATSSSIENTTVATVVDARPPNGAILERGCFRQYSPLPKQKGAAAIRLLRAKFVKHKSAPADLGLSNSNHQLSHRNHDGSSTGVDDFYDGSGYDDTTGRSFLDDTTADNDGDDEFVDDDPIVLVATELPCSLSSTSGSTFSLPKPTSSSSFSSGLPSSKCLSAPTTKTPTTTTPPTFQITSQALPLVKDRDGLSRSYHRSSTRNNRQSNKKSRSRSTSVSKTMVRNSKLSSTQKLSFPPSMSPFKKKQRAMQRQVPELHDIDNNARKSKRNPQKTKKAKISEFQRLEEAIAKHEEWCHGGIRTGIQVHLDRALARYHSQNMVGACLALKRMKQLEKEQAHLTKAIGYLKLLQQDVQRMRLQQIDDRLFLSGSGYEKVHPGEQPLIKQPRQKLRKVSDQKEPHQEETEMVVVVNDDDDPLLLSPAKAASYLKYASSAPSTHVSLISGTTTKPTCVTPPPRVISSSCSSSSNSSLQQEQQQQQQQQEHADPSEATCSPRLTGNGKNRAKKKHHSASKILERASSGGTRRSAAAATNCTNSQYNNNNNNKMTKSPWSEYPQHALCFKRTTQKILRKIDRRRHLGGLDLATTTMPSATIKPLGSSSGHSRLRRRLRRAKAPLALDYCDDQDNTTAHGDEDNEEKDIVLEQALLDEDFVDGLFGPELVEVESKTNHEDDGDNEDEEDNDEDDEDDWLQVRIDMILNTQVDENLDHALLDIDDGDGNETQILLKELAELSEIAAAAVARKNTIATPTTNVNTSNSPIS